MFAVRQDAGRSGALSLASWRVAGKSRLRLPASGIELGYIALIAAFAAILGVALVSFTATTTTPLTLAPALPGAPTDKATIYAATAGTTRKTGGAGQITGEGMSPTLVHNLGARSALTSAVGRF